jgi:mannose-6-phosphate isomerase-like protein (cupin superfamily)
VFVIRSQQAPRFEVPGVRFAGLAAPSRGSSEVCTWRITVEPNLRSPEPHTIDHDEIFMVTAGALQLVPDGDVLRAGDAGVVPAGQPIQLVNPDGEPAEAYVAITANFTATTADGIPLGTPPWAN